MKEARRGGRKGLLLSGGEDGLGSCEGGGCEGEDEDGGEG